MKLVLLGLAVAGIVAVGIPVTYGVRWYLALDDLQSSAKPAGFEQVAYRRTCGNAGGPCSNVWLYTSHERTADQALSELATRFRQKGWNVSAGCGVASTPVCEVHASKPDSCFVWKNLQTVRGDEGWRVEYLSADTEAIWILGGGCG